MVDVPLDPKALDAAHQALNRHRSSRHELVGPPTPGDLLKLPGSDRLEWLLLDGDLSVDTAVIVVPVDGFALIGSGDLEVGHGSPVGVLAVRGRHPIRLPSAVLEVASKIGVLEDGDFQRIDTRIREVEAGGIVGTMSGREVDRDPEYQDWIDHVVIPEVRSVVERYGRLEAITDSGSEGDTDPEPGSRPPRSNDDDAPSEGRVVPFRRRRGPLLLAATLLLAVGTALLAGRAWQLNRKVKDLGAIAQQAEQLREALDRLEATRIEAEAQSQEEIGRLEAERLDLESRLAALETSQSEGEQQLRRRIADLDARLIAAQLAGEVVNPVVAVLRPPGSQRGKARIELDLSASHVMFDIRLPEGFAERYQVRIRRTGEQKPVWRKGDLRLDAAGRLVFGVLTDLVRHGEYRMLLEEWKDGGYQKFGEYEVTFVESESRNG
ncbi:MAG: hypothetical protein AAGD06_27800 [Acidobacteriota bacterium]